jgi:hypothetical protein
MFQTRVMSQELPSAKLKLAIVGPEKNGKSRLAATARAPVLVHDFDNRAEALASLEGVYVMSYIDPQWPRQPEAIQDFLSNLAKLEDGADLRSLGFDGVEPGLKPRTNVIDSIHTFARSAQRYCMYNNSDIRREITVGPMKIHIPRNFDAWNAEMSIVESAILRLLALPQDTIIILHEVAEEAPDSTPEKPHFTGRVSVYPPRYKLLLKYFNEVWRVKLTPVKSQMIPRVYPLPDYQFDAASALPLNGIEEPNISAILQRVLTQTQKKEIKTNA